MMTIAGTTVMTKLAGITTIFDFRYYSWSSEHQDYDCNTLPLTTISWKWISLVLSCFKYVSADDRQCITLGESFWTMNQFLGVWNWFKVCSEWPQCIPSWSMISICIYNQDLFKHGIIIGLDICEMSRLKSMLDNSKTSSHPETTLKNQTLSFTWIFRDNTIP